MQEKSRKKKFGTSKFEFSEGSLRDVLRTSWRRPESTSQGSLLNVRLGRPLDVILGRLEDVRSGRPRDCELKCPRTSRGPTFVGWVNIN